ncbi:hypothetical protein NVP1291O_04 [Vibrio phage 1.291.O._10N.286.55.F6]|nr:hypothetical protein NVP1291O_04 [Vibrio phage 1.291.O._10N.286.55.F6]
MKMNDWFKSEIRLHGDIIECNDFAYAEMSCEYTVNDIDAGDAICHAINNHDRMVEEIAELREFVKTVADGDSASSEAKSFMVHAYIHSAKQLLNK